MLNIQPNLNKSYFIQGKNIMKPEELDKLVETLIFVSNLDGELTEDEQSIIDVVKKNVESFKKAYLEVWSDYTLSDDDKKRLRNLWTNIMLETTKTAIKDQRYTKDELSLVYRIFSTLINGME